MHEHTLVVLFSQISVNVCVCVCVCLCLFAFSGVCGIRIVWSLSTRLIAISAHASQTMFVCRNNFRSMVCLLFSIQTHIRYQLYVLCCVLIVVFAIQSDRPLVSVPIEMIFSEFYIGEGSLLWT